MLLKIKALVLLCKMKDTITKTRQAEYCGVLLFDL